MKNGFSLHTAETAPAASRPLLETSGAAWGFVPNLHGVLAESPAALEAYGSLWTLAEKTALTAVERNVANLAIIDENACAYCMAGQSGLSKMQSVAAGQIAAIRENRPLTDQRLEALRAFAANITRNRGVVAPDDVAAFKAAGFTNQSILELLVLGAAKLISNYTNHIAETPNDAFMKGNEWARPGAQARNPA